LQCSLRPTWIHWEEEGRGEGAEMAEELVKYIRAREGWSFEEGWDIWERRKEG
jgi:hypothetical protein